MTDRNLFLVRLRGMSYEETVLYNVYLVLVLVLALLSNTALAFNILQEFASQHFSSSEPEAQNVKLLEERTDAMMDLCSELHLLSSGRRSASTLSMY
jgi:hypothetical protein